MAKPKKLLMVALRYPPLTGTGIIRTLKYQKYLPLHGWVADCVTSAHAPDAPPFSAEPAHEGPGRTYRIRFPEPLRMATRFESTGRQEPPSAVRAAAATALRRVARYLLVPDNHAFFVPVGFARFRVVDSQHRVVYGSGMTSSGLLAAAGLSVRLRLPLVLDLRDPWIEPSVGRHGAFRLTIESLLERSALRRADAVTVTAPGLAEDLIVRRPWLRGKVHIIPNGYDEDDFSGPQATPLGDFDIVHTGIFYGTKGPEPFFEGLGRWLAGSVKRRPQIRVRMVGPIRKSDREAAARHGVADVTVFEAPVPHREAVARLRASNLAIAVDFADSQARTRVLSKVFEYMRSGKPILFLSAGGGTEAILARCPRAVIVPKDDPNAVADALDRIVTNAGAASTPFIPDDHTRSFERAVLAAKLAEILEVTCGQVADPPRSRVS